MSEVIMTGTALYGIGNAFRYVADTIESRVVDAVKYIVGETVAQKIEDALLNELNFIASHKQSLLLFLASMAFYKLMKKYYQRLNEQPQANHTIVIQGNNPLIMQALNGVVLQAINGFAAANPPLVIQVNNVPVIQANNAPGIQANNTPVITDEKSRRPRVN